MERAVCGIVGPSARFLLLSREQQNANQVPPGLSRPYWVFLPQLPPQPWERLCVGGREVNTTRRKWTQVACPTLPGRLLLPQLPWPGQMVW